mgnify:CR=1 FL=1
MQGTSILIALEWVAPPSTVTLTVSALAAESAWQLIMTLLSGMWIVAADNFYYGSNYVCKFGSVVMNATQGSSSLSASIHRRAAPEATPAQLPAFFGAALAASVQREQPVQPRSFLDEWCKRLPKAELAPDIR